MDGAAAGGVEATAYAAASHSDAAAETANAGNSAPVEAGAPAGSPAAPSAEASLKRGSFSGGEKDNMEVPSEGGEEGEEKVAPPRMGPGVCVFCNVEAASFEENCAHMLHHHG